MTMRSQGSVLPLFLGSAPDVLQGFGYLLKDVASSKSQPVISRNFGGSVDAAELYRGHGGSSAQRAATAAMLGELAVHMKVCDLPGSDDNTTIPAGYTYLAQMAAHDIVHNIAPLPRLGEISEYFARDFRSERLIFDTMYGGGPSATQLPYSINGRPRNQRHELRLGRNPKSEAGLTGPRPVPMDDRPARDIGRVSCPHLSDRPGEGVPDALIADPRNDDHLLISQLLALFHALHNIVSAKLAAGDGGSATPNDDFRTYRRFLEARKIVAIVWRKVIVNDLLKRLLEPGVHAYYASAQTRYPTDFIDKTDDGRVPVEFSHAAYRFGHVMIRFSYELNDRRLNGAELETASIGEILDRSSSRQPRRLPVACTWLVDWSRFFDMGDGQKLNFSRRITPVVHGSLAGDSYFPNENGADGGLFYRDFIRGVDAGIRSVASLIAGLKPSERQRSRLLNDPNYREHEIGLWLNPCGGHKFSTADQISLSQDPPLLFFILFEAAHEHNGERLGILGSTIIAEVFFAALKKTQATIEDDPMIASGVASVFGSSVPGDMPALIDFIKQNGGLQDAACT